MWTIRLLALCLSASYVLAGEEQMSSGMRVIYSAYKQCEQDADPLVCLKARAVKFIDRALTSENIHLVDGVNLIKNPENEGERSLSNNLVLEEIPTDLEARANKIDDILWNRVTAFAQTHSVQFKVPEYIREMVLDGAEEEGRGKKKKLWPLLILGAFFKGSMLHMAIKGLAVLAAKALMVSKLALLLAGIVALKKIFGGGSEKTTYEIVKQPIVSHSHQYSNSHDFGGYEGGFDGGHGGYGRSFDSMPYPAHRMAYKAQIPDEEKTAN